MTSLAELSILQSALQSVGIQLPAPKALPALVEPQATADDVLTAILASKQDNPYADPHVIAVIAECQAQELGTLSNLYSAMQVEANADEARAQHKSLDTKLRALFAEHAATIETAAQTLGTVKDPARIDLNRAPTHRARAAVDLMPALAALDKTTAAWRALHNFKHPLVLDPRAKLFVYTNPTADQWETLREDPSPWEAARHGIALDLAATLRAADGRRTELMNTRQRHREAMEASSPGHIGW